MKRLFFGLAALPFLAGVSMAAQPVPLSDTQMDGITAGFDFSEAECQNTGCVVVEVNKPLQIQAGGTPANPCPTCYLVVNNSYYKNSSVLAMQVQAQFGPTPVLFNNQ